MMIGRINGIAVSVALLTVVTVLCSTPIPNQVEESAASSGEDLTVELFLVLDRAGRHHEEQSADPSSGGKWTEVCNAYMRTIMANHIMHHGGENLNAQLLLALNRGEELETIRHLIEQGADPGSEEEQNTYMYAVLLNRIDLLLVLVESRHFHPRYLNKARKLLEYLHQDLHIGMGFEPMKSVVANILRKYSSVTTPEPQYHQQERLNNEEEEKKLAKRERHMARRAAANHQRMQMENRQHQNQQSQLQNLEPGPSIEEHGSPDVGNTNSILSSQNIPPIVTLAPAVIPEPLVTPAPAVIPEPLVTPAPAVIPEPVVNPEPIIDEYEHHVLARIEVEKERNRIDFLDAPILDEPPDVNIEPSEIDSLQAKARQKENRLRLQAKGQSKPKN